MNRCWVLVLGVFFLMSACERGGAEDEEAVAQEATSDQPGESVEGGEEEERGEEEQHHGDDDVHLGDFMNDLGMRFAAVWYAGEANNAEMVDYQIHEMEEAVDELRQVSPEEEGVDVVAFFDSNILPALEELEEAAESGEGFEASYDAVIQQCNACHIMTKHEFVKLKRPDFNPYPNLDFSGE